MSQYEKLLIKILRGTSDKNIDFDELVNLLNQFGFRMREKGSHCIFSKPGIDEIFNLQPVGKQAKPYQVRQVRELILKYKLHVNEDEA